jgi:hypothetical protein
MVSSRKILAQSRTFGGRAAQCRESAWAAKRLAIIVCQSRKKERKEELLF